MNALMQLSAIFVLSFWCFGATEGLKCYSCGHMEGVEIPPGYEDMFDESCAEGNTPDDKFVHTCGTGDESEWPICDWSCLTLSYFMELEHVSANVTARGCVGSLPKFNDRCVRRSLLILKNDPDLPKELKDLLARLPEEMDATLIKICMDKNGIKLGINDESGGNSDKCSTSGATSLINNTSFLLPVIFAFVKLSVTVT